MRLSPAAVGAAAAAWAVDAAEYLLSRTLGTCANTGGLLDKATLSFQPRTCELCRLRRVSCSLRAQGPPAPQCCGSRACARLRAACPRGSSAAVPGGCPHCLESWPETCAQGFAGADREPSDGWSKNGCGVVTVAVDVAVAVAAVAVRVVFVLCVVVSLCLLCFGDKLRHMYMGASWGTGAGAAWGTGELCSPVYTSKMA